ncbi:MAG: HDIG domain-containing protein [Bacteroidales bacterium]|nr:HDIG domain-containing protein [Bacteroidales bacterium]
MKEFFSYITHHYKLIYKGLLFVISIALLVSFFPKEGKFKYDFDRGKPWRHENLIAPFDFAISKSEEELNLEIEEALSTVFPYYVFNEELSQKHLKSFSDNFQQKWGFKSTGDSVDLMKVNFDFGYSLLDSVLHIGIIQLDAAPEYKDSSNKIILIRGNVAEEVTLGNLFTIGDAYIYIREKLQQNELIDMPFLIGLLENELIQNVVHDPDLTEVEKENARSSVSITRGMIQHGERIISEGELVNAEKYQVLESLKKEYETRLGPSSSYTLILAGQIVLITIALSALFLFIYFFRKDIFFDNRRLLLISLVIVLMVLLTAFTTNYYPDYLFLLPICLTPIIIRAFFDSRMALFIHLITVIIIGFLVPNSFDFVFLQLIAGIITVISIVVLHRRSQFFLTSLLIFFTYSVIYIALALIHDGSFNQINTTYFVLFAGSAILTLFSYPLIFIFEKMFGYITDVTLMELSDTNTKLLRELSGKAPGTFQHSLQVANIAEEVIYKIGGNALLVRTGALYHDIGKMNNPLYFIENQVTGANPHDELTYEESAEIIIGHVINGVEKAKKHKLPEPLIDFIRTHHGTRRVEYFYVKEKEHFPDENVDESRYKYHGPIPFSRETAVLMMADSVEAASRSLRFPDEQKIDNLVEKIIGSQIAEAQLENANLTLREITQIKKILKRKLLNIYHIRIEYPGD